jgi:allophanate hydrolase
MMDLASLKHLRPTEIVEEVYRKIAPGPEWILIVPKEQALRRAAALESSPESMKLPLCGVPFAVKDNIDVAGLPTTAGCPAFAYTPEKSAEVVERLIAAGAILIGKTNLDQFATGLVGVRSPYGICSSVFDERYISGGSSAGSAVAVAKGLVAFSLGTDTAGSGRVPAAFNNIVGTKPTIGAISVDGVVPACKSLDCVSIFAANPDDALTVLNVARAGYRETAAPWVGSEFRFGVPPQDQLEFFGDSDAEVLFEKAVTDMESRGGTKVEIDFRPFRATADLLYSGPWVAERLAAIQSFYNDHHEEMNPTVRGIVGGASKYSAVDTFNAMYRLAELRKETLSQWARMDVMLLPTTGTTYTIEAVLADPIALNTKLGFYTNFVNLLDLAAVAIPAGFRPNGLPFGVTLIGPAGTDTALHRLASGSYPATPPGCVLVAVLGAHLSGQPLNWQLTDRGARLKKTCKTAPFYRFYSLGAKPGLVREEGFAGPGIEVEVWAVPAEHFGSFVALIPPPLSIGTATLEDGSTVKCFLCEPYALAEAKEITDLGGWRAHLATSTL